MSPKTLAFFLLAISLACPSIAQTDEELMKAGIGRRIADAEKSFSDATARCTADEQKFFLVSLKKKVEASTTLAQIRLAGVVPLEARLNVGSRGYGFPVRASQSDDQALTELRQVVLADVDRTLKDESAPVHPQLNTPQNASRRRQEIALSKTTLANQKATPTPLLNGWFVTGTCSSAIRLRDLLAADLLAIEPSTEHRRGFAIPLEFLTYDE